MESEKNFDAFIALFVGTVILFLLAVGIVYVVFAYRRKVKEQRQNLIDAQQRIQLEILDKNMEAMEIERKRFAADLHDDVGGKLAALRLGLARLKNNPDDKIIIDTIVDNSKKMLDNIIDVTRRISHNMAPPSLEVFGIETALGDLCDWINESSGINVIFVSSVDGVSISRKIEIGIYRIVQELLSNSIKHANATTIEINLSITDNAIKLEYLDDGIGFKKDNMPRGKGMGIKNIEERLMVLNAKIFYRDNITKGFGCIIESPLK